MKILITGANGMVAGAALRHCRSLGDEAVGMTRQELDISDREAVFETFERERFDAILNCAAYTDVDGAEADPEICYRVNADGVENLALGAGRIDAGFVTISTDYVFTGDKTDFYTQRDTPVPLKSVYSESKLEGERRARDAYARSIIVRSGWIFGPGGTNFLSVMHRLLAEGKNIKVINDSFGTPTYAAHLARRMRELAELDLPCVFHVTNSGGGTSYEGFARKVCRLRGFDESLLESVSHKDLRRPAPRPLSSKLKCLFSQKFGLAPLPGWEEALAEFLDFGIGSSDFGIGS
ncbi:MAG: dTDP-4-dehydrorhamnose reductase [Pyrinomonadaceae bacterium]